MDAIGTPFCVTIDHQTLQDDTVTLRDRDTMKQERIKIASLKSVIREAVSIPELLRKI
jgi:glycyl-tRNA synthetase